MTAQKKQVVYREADKGLFVTEEYAKKHPKTTVKETNKRGK